MAFALTSAAFQQNDPVPVRFTCDGDDLSPPLAWTDAPSGTRAFALMLEDPDAPSGAFTHWLLADIPANALSIAEGGDIGVPGINDFGRTGYGGPCPPKGRGRHRYRIQLHALSRAIGLPAGFDRQRFDAALRGSVLGTAILNGWYERPAGKAAGRRA
jgi:Raf kinase inhibitor-like YbhB/YbcL family protein